MKKIYFAGKFNFISKKGTLPERLVNDYRSIILGNSSKLTFADKNTMLQNYPIKYCGPFYCEQASNGNFTSTDCSTVITEEMKFIKDCEIFCCVFDLNFSVGSIVELIEAAHLKKRIVIFYKNESNNYTIKSEYWFAISKAMDICKTNNTIFETFSYEDNLLPVLYNWLTNLNYSKRYVCTRESSLNDLLKEGVITNIYEYFGKQVTQYELIDIEKKIVVEKYSNGLTMVKSEKKLEIKGFVDVTNNQLYLDENINKIKFNKVFIEGTDGVGKTSTIAKLIEQGIVCLDRSEFICKYMLFEIPMDVRIRAYQNYLEEISPYYVIFLINNSKQELENRISKREYISEFDNLSYEYNKLYLDTYNEFNKQNSNNEIKLIDCTGLSEEEQLIKVKNCILRSCINE